MTPEKTKEYVEYRLHQLGWEANIIDGAHVKIYEHTGGARNRINELCESLFSIGSSDTKASITVSKVKLAIKELTQNANKKNSNRNNRGADTMRKTSKTKEEDLFSIQQLAADLEVTLSTEDETNRIDSADITNNQTGKLQANDVDLVADYINQAHGSNSKAIETGLEDVAKNQQRQAREVDRGELKVLVVDDSATVRAVITKAVRDEISCLQARDGEEGWSVLKENDDIGVVLVDLDMPKLSGYGLIKRIRSADASHIREILILVITGTEDLDAKRKALEAGASDFLTKDIDPIELLARVRTYCNLAAAKRSLLQHGRSTGQVDREPTRLRSVESSAPATVNKTAKTKPAPPTQLKTKVPQSKKRTAAESVRIEPSKRKSRQQSKGTGAATQESRPEPLLARLSSRLASVLNIFSASDQGSTKQKSQLESLIARVPEGLRRFWSESVWDKLQGKNALGKISIAGSAAVVIGIPIIIILYMNRTGPNEGNVGIDQNKTDIVAEQKIYEFPQQTPASSSSTNTAGSLQDTAKTRVDGSVAQRVNSEAASRLPERSVVASPGGDIRDAKQKEAGRQKVLLPSGHDRPATKKIVSTTKPKTARQQSGKRLISEPREKTTASTGVSVAAKTGKLTTVARLHPSQTTGDEAQQHARIGQRTKKTRKAVSTRLSLRELNGFLKRFALVYNAGDYEQFMAMFAESARTNDRTTRDGIGRDYRELFQSTDLRRMQLGEFDWELNKDEANGWGNFEVSIRKVQENEAKTYTGSLTFHVKKMQGRLRIISLYHGQRRAGSQ